MASPIVRLNFCCTGKRATKGALELKDYMFNSMGRKEIGSDVLTGCSRGEFFDILERCWDILAARLWVMISDFLRPLCCVVERSELMTESARRSDEKLSPDSIWQLIFWQTAFCLCWRREGKWFTSGLVSCWASMYFLWAFSIFPILCKKDWFSHTFAPGIPSVVHFGSLSGELKSNLKFKQAENSIQKTF